MTINSLLDFIAQPESRGDYDAIWGGISKSDYPTNPITWMTLGEVLAWQHSIDHKYMSEAVGAWQFLEDTLRGQYRTAGVPLSAKFDEETQRKLATSLLERRGLGDYLAGRIDAEEFGQNLSKEWASLPAFTHDQRGRPADGQSYYAGDGLNAAHVTRESVLSAIGKVKAKPAPDPRENPTKSKTIRASGAAAVATASGGIFTAMANLDPGVQYAIIGCAVVALGFIGYVAWERLKKWGRGER